MSQLATKEVDYDWKMRQHEHNLTNYDYDQDQDINTEPTTDWLQIPRKKWVKDFSQNNNLTQLTPLTNQNQL
jgi:hypothetical protein